MSAIVQLSFNVSEKLRLDDHAFPTFESSHHKSEAQSTQSSKTISASAKESEEQRTSQPPGLTSFVPSTLTSSSTSNIMPETGFFGAPGSVFGVACPRYDHQKSSAFPRRDIKPVALVRTSTNIADTSQTTVYDLRECSPHMQSRKTVTSTHSSDKHRVFTASACSQSVKIDNSDQTLVNTINEVQQKNTFPSIVGKSCILHPSKKQSSVTTSSVADVPPIKKHCRSVSEPDDLMDLSPERSLQSPSWRPTGSRVWVPPAGRYYSSRRAHSASAYSGKFLRDCSRSLDCGRMLHSVSSVSGDSLLTPPDSPVPRPASVTVIKQEGGAWTFLSSQHTASGHFKQCSFSPLPSPCSTRSQDAGFKSCHTGLSATKRSLSFSDDFEHRESIQYTPTSTPELERRFDRNYRRGGLLRCQSHPSDLNLKRSKGRRRPRVCHNRPTLDFAKMKQTSINKRNRCRDRSLSGSTSTFTSLPSDPTHVKPVFPSIFDSENLLKKNTTHKLQPVPSLSPPSVSFSIGCTRPLNDIHRRIPSPTDELANEPDSDTIPEVDGDIVTASGGVASPFVRECHDLDVDQIENETDCDDDMKT